MHGGVVNDPVYLNRGTVLKKFVMLEKESGPVVVELPGSVMAWGGLGGLRWFLWGIVRRGLREREWNHLMD